MSESRFSPLVGLLPFVMFALVQNGLPRLYAMSDVTKSVLWFAAGLLCSSLIKRFFKRLLSRNTATTTTTPPAQDKGIYSLKHGILNLETANISMWMNMGYWADQREPRDFPHACKSLLRELLVAAGVAHDRIDRAPDLLTDRHPSRAPVINIVDVGYGCGDQTMALVDMVDLGSYVGITLDRQQFERAQDRLSKRHFLVSANDPASPVRQIFHADAAQPRTWRAMLTDAVVRCCHQGSSETEQNNWILALDVIYHFSPSRLPFFTYACQKLHASVMAFDLLLPDTGHRCLTHTERLVLRLVSLMTSTPYANFLTPTQYRAQLAAAGYAEHEIEIRDISVDVFGPLADFLTWHDQQLKGLDMGIGAFHAARWLFDWWARTGTVRGCIIIARWKPTNKGN